MVPAQQWAALQAGTLDIGFTRPNPGSLFGNAIRTEKFFTERLYAVLPKDHSLAKRKEIAVNELRNERFVMSERQTSPTVFDKIITLCADADFSPHIVTTATVSSGVMALVEAGEGISIVPDGSRFLGSNEVLFIPLQGTAASVDLVIAWPANRSEGVHRSFLQLARRFRTQKPLPA
jgi:DNA-binding transcriptional LysR family regulator